MDVTLTRESAGSSHPRAGLAGRDRLGGVARDEHQVGRLPQRGDVFQRRRQMDGRKLGVQGRGGHARPVMVVVQ
ncbi:MAG: hypothetical protein M3O70_14500 [Actinomycetota bacterium]|nr:hypothetical protein [Actinomycetota bacterium]